MVTGEESLVKSTEASCDRRVAEELSALKDWMEYTRSEKMNADQAELTNWKMKSEKQWKLRNNQIE